MIDENSPWTNVSHINPASPAIRGWSIHLFVDCLLTLLKNIYIQHLLSELKILIMRACSTHITVKPVVGLGVSLQYYCHAMLVFEWHFAATKFQVAASKFQVQVPGLNLWRKGMVFTYITLDIFSGISQIDCYGK